MSESKDLVSMSLGVSIEVSSVQQSVSKNFSVPIQKNCVIWIFNTNLNKYLVLK